MDTINVMFEKAKQAQTKSYSPYSNFKVGACLRCSNDQFFVGCNYENAAYSLCLCAEGSAIAAMINAGYHEILELAVIGSSVQPCSPCGACRQRIREFAKPDILIHMFNQTGKHITMTLAELLPQSFGPEFLQK